MAKTTARIFVFFVVVLLLVGCNRQEQVIEMRSCPSGQAVLNADKTATCIVLDAVAEVAATATRLPATATPIALATKSADLSSFSGKNTVQASQEAEEPSAPIPTLMGLAWSVTAYDRLAESPIVAAWISRLQAPAPALWPTFPNVPNPLVPEFRVVNGTEVPWGMEYGVPNVPFCQQDQRCDFIVPAWHYRLITADYAFQGMECRNTEEDPKGCMLLLINIMDQSYTWRDQSADNGFTVAGRYWDGDNLEWGVWGLVSHTAASMLNMPTVRNSVTGDILNAGTLGNAGANCGHVEGCGKVEARVVVHAGDALVAVLETTVTRDGTVATRSPAAIDAAIEATSPAAEIINISADGIVEIPAGYVVVGDVEVAPSASGPWKVFYDNDGTTGLVVVMNNNGFVKAPWGASASNRPSAEVEAEVKTTGCGSGCSRVDVQQWP